MADTQNQILITDFTNQLDYEAQQAKSKFRGRIMEAPVTGKIFEHQLLGGVNQKQVTSRFEDIVATNPDHQRRGANLKMFYDTIFIDNDDALKSIVDIKSGYAKTLAKSAMRQMDKVVAEAALGNILTGENFTTSVTAAADGVQTVTAGSGLTYDKVREVKQRLNSQDVGLDGEKMYLAMTDVQASTLLDEIEVISSDYNIAEAARTGNLPEVLGFELMVFSSAPQTGNSIINKTGSTRECFAFSEDALKLGLLSDFDVRYERRPDKVDTHQLVITSRYAALRAEGARICQIDVTES